MVDDNVTYLWQPAGLVRVWNIILGLAAICAFVVCFNDFSLGKTVGNDSLSKNNTKNVEEFNRGYFSAPGLKNQLFNIVYLAIICAVLLASIIMLIVVIVNYESMNIEQINRYVHVFIGLVTLAAVAIGSYGLFDFHRSYYKETIEKYGWKHLPNATIAGGISLALSWLNFIFYIIATMLV